MSQMCHKPGGLLDEHFDFLDSQWVTELGTHERAAAALRDEHDDR